MRNIKYDAAQHREGRSRRTVHREINNTHDERGAREGSAVDEDGPQHARMIDSVLDAFTRQHTLTTLRRTAVGRHDLIVERGDGEDLDAGLEDRRNRLAIPQACRAARVLELKELTRRLALCNRSESIDSSSDAPT